MSIFDLLFLALALAIAITLIVILIQLLLGRRKAALRVLLCLGACLLAYFAVVAVVAVASPQRTYSMGEERCSDELCFAVIGVRTATALGPAGHSVKPSGQFVLVTVRATSHARRRPQRDLGISAELLDYRGHVYHPNAAGQEAYQAEYGANPPLASLLQPGGTFYSVQVFDVPTSADSLAFHFHHAGPGLFIIGDEESPLHKPTITPLTGI